MVRTQVVYRRETLTIFGCEKSPRHESAQKTNVWSRKCGLGSRRNTDMVERHGSANDGSHRIIILAHCYIRVYYLKKSRERPVVYSCTLW